MVVLVGLFIEFHSVGARYAVGICRVSAFRVSTLTQALQGNHIWWLRGCVSGHEHHCRTLPLLASHGPYIKLRVVVSILGRI